MLLPLLRRL